MTAPPIAVEVPWWGLLLIAVAGLVAFVPLVIVLVVVGEAVGGVVGHLRKRRTREGTPTLAFPYYVDEAGLRSLASGLKLELPIAREVTKSRKLSVGRKEFGGERGRSETAQLAASIDLNRLADEIAERLSDEELASELAIAPYVSDQEILADAAARIQEDLGETSKTRELLAALQQAYEHEKLQTVAKEKREELRETASRRKLVIIRGRFAHEKASNSTADWPLKGPLHLTALETLRMVRRPLRLPPEEIDPFVLDHYYSRRHVEATRAEMPFPSDVSIRVTLPDSKALTPSGHERLGRDEPFYARVIAHSPSFDEATGGLTCAAYAVWGVPTGHMPMTALPWLLLHKRDCGHCRQPGGGVTRLRPPGYETCVARSCNAPKRTVPRPPLA